MPGPNSSAAILYAVLAVVVLLWTWVSYKNWTIMSDNASLPAGGTPKPTYLKGLTGTTDTFPFGTLDSFSQIIVNWGGIAAIGLIGVGLVALAVLEMQGTDTIQMLSTIGQGCRQSYQPPMNFRRPPMMMPPMMQQPMMTPMTVDQLPMTAMPPQQFQ